jgi:Holliday junction resolvase RusA-like endonuclease
MRSACRRALRGEVSVELQIFAPDGVDAPSAPRSVKRYLDALQGIVYANDRQVGHLCVRRFASDHPYMRDRADRVGNQQDPVGAHTVFVTVLPLRLYVADYDRVFGSGYGLMQDDSDVDPDAMAFFEDGWEHRDGDELDDLYDERREDIQGTGLYSLSEPTMAETMRAIRERRIRELQGRFLLHQRPDRYDRPGRDLAARDEELIASFGMAAIAAPDKYELPGTIWLPPLFTRPRLPTEASWKDSVRAKFEGHRAHWAQLPSAFEQPVALDIAIHGAASTTHDIDNVAHSILAAFEDQYCGDNRGTVVAYRVYRQASGHSGVRVHLMTGQKLTQLDDAIAEARRLVLSRGPDD